jgi:ferredoxin/flavodoxin
MKYFIIYISPAGTTRHVAQRIEKTLCDLTYEVESFDLGARITISDLTARIREAGNDVCLFIGSPVYGCHAVPPVMEFMMQLPDNGKGYSVPFVTYGVVTSGIALHEMGMTLNRKGYTVIGAAKIVAVHSLMWRAHNPLGEGHPDAADNQMIEEMVRKVHGKLSSKPVKVLPLSELDYQPPGVRENMRKVTLEAARQFLPPRQVNTEACTLCGICVEKCPVEALTLDPYPVFGATCFLCYNCVRLCPENAINTDLSKMEAPLKKGAEKTAEPGSKIFF